MGYIELVIEAEDACGGGRPDEELGVVPAPGVGVDGFDGVEVCWLLDVGVGVADGLGILGVIERVIAWTLWLEDTVLAYIFSLLCFSFFFLRFPP